MYVSIDFSLVALIPSVREPLSSRPEVERFREAYLKGSLGLPWRRKVPPGGPFWASRGSILGFQGVHFGPRRVPCKESAPRKAQPSILGTILGSFWGPFGIPGVISGSFWEPFGGPFGAISRSFFGPRFWKPFGTHVGPFWGRFGTKWIPKNSEKR